MMYSCYEECNFRPNLIIQNWCMLWVLVAILYSSNECREKAPSQDSNEEKDEEKPKPKPVNLIKLVSLTACILTCIDREYFALKIFGCVHMHNFPWLITTLLCM